MNEQQTERLAQWWAELSDEQRAEAKMAALTGPQGDYPNWLIEALHKQVPTVEAFAWYGDDPSAGIKTMRPDLVDWLNAQDDD